MYFKCRTNQDSFQGKSWGLGGKNNTASRSGWYKEFFSLERVSTEYSSPRFWPLVTSEEGTSCRNRGAREILRGVLFNATTTISTWWSYTLSAALVNYEDFEVKGRALYPGPASAEHTAHTEQSFSKSLAEDITDSESCLGWKGTLKVTDLVQVEDNSS